MPGGHFAPHFDGYFARSTQERSLQTFMLYLNGNFEGGSTNFVDEKQTLFMVYDIYIMYIIYVSVYRECITTVQACPGLKNFYSKFLPIRGLCQGLPGVSVYIFIYSGFINSAHMFCLGEYLMRKLYHQ